ncbi:MAG: Mrp/NBP35 family ATP-binding protein [Bacteroidales bacterium]|nr:Mrp/NBP35 family ATP-binding protein [Bacteroidales bacterium]
MAECNHDCANCSQQNCEKKDLHENPNVHSNIKKIIGIVSGKGGVGKSSVTSLLAVQLRRKGYHVGILDADITGPSIPKMFNLHELVKGNEDGVFPAKTEMGIHVMSANLLTDDEKTPVIWRGPLVAGMVKQFWTEVIWDNIDFLLVDMPPGTGDVPLTVFQTMDVDGIIMVTSPQDLVSLIVSKAVNMAGMMNIPILGLVENYSYALCPHCGEKIPVFGESHAAEVAREFNLPLLAQMPIDTRIAQLADKGEMEKAEVDYLDPVLNILESLDAK